MIPLLIEQVVQSPAYTLFLLKGEKKIFSVYTAAHVGPHIASFLSESPPKRPHTHELLLSILESLGAKPLRAVFYDEKEGVYFCRLLVEQKETEATRLVDIDSKPSDCLAIAMLTQMPLFCEAELFARLNSSST